MNILKYQFIKKNQLKFLYLKKILILVKNYLTLQVMIYIETYIDLYQNSRYSEIKKNIKLTYKKLHRKIIITNCNELTYLALYKLEIS